MGQNMELVTGQCGHLACWTKHIACVFVHPLALSPHSAGLFSLHSLCISLAG